MKTLNISEIEEKEHSSSITVRKPKKDSYSDITAVNYELKRAETYSASIKIIQKDNFSFDVKSFKENEL
jgi:hypothetical protein